MTENKSVFGCKICNKNYASYNSLGNHNRKFHNSIHNDVKGQKQSKNNTLLVKKGQKKSKNNINDYMKDYNCRKCNKICNNKQSRWYHEKICKNEIILYDNKIEQLENKIIELENIITNNGTNNTNYGTINNTTNNNTTNIIKVSFGEEDISILSDKDKKSIMNSGFSSMIKLIETIHLNKNYKQFQNVQISNLKDKYAKYYDEKINNFITVSKTELIDEIICYRTLNLKEIHDEYNKNTIKHNNVLKLINKLENYTPEDDDDKLYKFYKELCSEITLLFYNKSKIFK